MSVFVLAVTALAVITGSAPAHAGEQEAIDGCIDRLRQVGGPDGRAGGRVLSSEFSQAGTLVKLQDAGGTIWRCVGYSDGTVGEMSVAEGADDGGGAMSGASSQLRGEPATTTERVRFQSGASGTELTGTLMPGSSTRYVLGARNGQNLYVRVAPNGSGIYYQIFNPDTSFLLEQMTPDREYRGQLWQTGDHVIEVLNRGNRTTSYNIIFSIE
jgi:hypothetical protein